MIKARRDEMRQRAKAADAGPWSTIHGAEVISARATLVADCDVEGRTLRDMANASFIAKANPTTVTEMLNHMDDQDGRIERLEATCCKGCEDEINRLREALEFIVDLPTSEAKDDFQKGLSHAAGVAMGFLNRGPND